MLPERTFEATRIALAFDWAEYEAMRDDVNRTARFQQAIEARLMKAPRETLTVLEIGTGPFALFAVTAATCGARKVYAVEANARAAAEARSRIRALGLQSKVEVLEGRSTEVQLPEAVDVVIAEVFGDIASEEGAVSTFRDARRFVRKPNDPDSWIPLGAQTLCAPAFYRYHGFLRPSQALRPVRTDGKDPEVQLLAAPKPVENFRFDDETSLGDSWATELQFEVRGPTLFSGFAFFPRIVFSRTPPIEFSEQTNWQYCTLLAAEQPAPCKQSSQPVNLICKAVLNPLPARYSLTARIG